VSGADGADAAAARQLLQTYGSQYTFGPSVPVSYWQNYVVRVRRARERGAERAMQAPPHVP
jgi:guanyl-specific ribonuclease Sa